MATPIIPLLLRELENRAGYWQRALCEITGADLVSPADRENVERAAEAWLRWCKEKGCEW